MSRDQSYALRQKKTSNLIFRENFVRCNKKKLSLFLEVSGQQFVSVLTRPVYDVDSYYFVLLVLKRTGHCIKMNRTIILQSLSPPLFFLSKFAFL